MTKADENELGRELWRAWMAALNDVNEVVSMRVNAINFGKRVLPSLALTEEQAAVFALAVRRFSERVDYTEQHEKRLLGNKLTAKRAATISKRIEVAKNFRKVLPELREFDERKVAAVEKFLYYGGKNGARPENPLRGEISEDAFEFMLELRQRKSNYDSQLRSRGRRSSTSPGASAEGLHGSVTKKKAGRSGASKKKTRGRGRRGSIESTSSDDSDSFSGSLSEVADPTPADDDDDYVPAKKQSKRRIGVARSTPASPVDLLEVDVEPTATTTTTIEPADEMYVDYSAPPAAGPFLTAAADLQFFSAEAEGEGEGAPLLVKLPDDDDETDIFIQSYVFESRTRAPLSPQI